MPPKNARGTDITRAQGHDTTNTVTFKDMEVLNKNENVLILDGSSNVIQSGDVVTMEGRLYKNGVLAKNTVLDVYKNGAMVGTVNTGSTGVASYNYTGLGVGETEFYFKYGSFVSETYSILDGTFFDKGILNDPQTNDNWTNRTTNPMEIIRNSEYTLIKAPSTSYGTYTPQITVDNDYCIEFNYNHQGTGAWYLNVQGYNITMSSYINESCKVKITVIDGTITIYKNDVALTPTRTISGGSTVFFQINNGGANIGYSNFVVYPI